MTISLFIGWTTTFAALSPVQNSWESVLNAPVMLCSDQEHHELLLYYTPYCPYSKKVLQYLQSIHKQVPMVNVQQDSAAKEELKRVGGKSQVPCLVIDGKAIYESDVIIHWLSQHQDELEPAN